MTKPYSTTETSQESNLSQKKQDDPHDQVSGEWIDHLQKVRKQDEADKQRRKSDSQTIARKKVTSKLHRKLL